MERGESKTLTGESVGRLCSLTRAIRLWISSSRAWKSGDLLTLARFPTALVSDFLEGSDLGLELLVELPQRAKTLLKPSPRLTSVTGVANRDTIPMSIQREDKSIWPIMKEKMC